MGRRQARLNAAIDKYGSDLILHFKPAANNASSDGDWPDPNEPPTAPPPASVTIKAVVWPEETRRDRESPATDEGVIPHEVINMVIKANVNLNEVARAEYLGGQYRIQEGDLYELANERLVQVVRLVRTKATDIMPYA